jgi:hypothetical protein
MAIPSFDKHGFLPAGVYDCTLDEIKGRFGRFELNDRRPALFERLSDFVREAGATGFVRFLLVDGSFVTARLDPNDIDLVVVLLRNHDLTAELLPGQYNVVSRRRVQRRYGFDIVSVREESVEYDEAVAFFTQVRHAPALRKGMLRLAL